MLTGESVPIEAVAGVNFCRINTNIDG
jgi:hypothetical protein